MSVMWFATYAGFLEVGDEARIDGVVGTVTARRLVRNHIVVGLDTGDEFILDRFFECHHRKSDEAPAGLVDMFRI